MGNAKGEKEMADKPLEGKVAIVTGAGSPIGMGRAMSLALVGAGARVTMIDINKEPLPSWAACIFW
jgi:3-oxoacyl-[acyl-carrier protein] reductase